jgi:hypothetical protein
MSGEVIAQRGDRLEGLLTRQRQALTDSPPGDLVSSPIPGHLIDGASSGAIVLVNGDDLIEAA